jgi:microcystin-dependent protein
MSSPFVAEIRIFAGNFAPTGWATCNGQLLPISQNTALFSLLGTFYGGDGKSNFALPKLEDASPLHQGQGPGLSERFLGETGGTETVTLLTSETPNHTHLMKGTNNDADFGSPANAYAGLPSSPIYRNDSDTTMSPNALGISGSSFPHNNRQPYLGLTFIIAMQGVFPPRS